MSVRRADNDRWRALGTRGAHVEIVEHDPEWPRVFEREAEAILEECRPCITEVHHIGSRPGLRTAEAEARVEVRDDRRTYTDAKAEFINMIIDTAMSQPAVERAERSSS